jgi:hypothetical protein
VGWGAKDFDFDIGNNPVINPPSVTKTLSCKKRFFDAIEDKSLIPTYTSDQNTAVQWGSDIVCRATTTGHSGVGITIVGRDMVAQHPLPRVPLYVKYQKKTHEYRIHLFRDDGIKIAEIQRKVFVATPDRPEPLNWQVRNHTQGFIIQSVPEAPEAVLEASQKVMEQFENLSFAALDVIYHEPSNLALVLEGNTAPGLEGPRLSIYGDFLEREYRRLM